MTAEVSRCDLGSLVELADGGQGKVYRLPQRAGWLLKLYHAHVAVDGRELRLLIQRPTGMTEPDRRLVLGWTAWPEAVVMDGPACVGFLMREAPTRFHTKLGGRSRLMEMQFLLHGAKPMWRDLALPAEAERRDLVRLYVQLFAALHRYDLVIGDVSMKNLLWTLSDGPAVFALDCDGFRVTGRHPAVEQAQTPEWDDPGMRPGRATLDSDRYKLALLVTRVLLTDHYVRPRDILADPARAERLGPALVALVEQASQPDRRPAAEAWLRALDGRPAIDLRPVARPVKRPAPPSPSRPTLSVRTPRPPRPTTQ